MARRTREEAEHTKQLLLDAAEQLFCDFGVAKTTLGDIACHAGVTRGAVYWHFENKSDLYQALLARGFEGMFATTKERMKQTAETHPARALWEYSYSLLTLNPDTVRMRRTLFIAFFRSEEWMEGEKIHEEFQTEIRYKVELIANILRLAVEKGEAFADIHPQTVAALIQSTHQGLIYNFMTGLDCTDCQYDIQNMLKCFYRGILHADVIEQCCQESEQGLSPSG